MVGVDLKPWEQWIDTDRILELHRIGIEQHGGLMGGAPKDCVDGALGSAFSSEAYFEGKRHAKAGLIFASHLLLYMLQRHCFVEGNKRASWSACMDVLAAQGLAVTATTDEAFAFVNSIIDHTLASGEEIAAWFAPRLYALP